MSNQSKIDIFPTIARLTQRLRDDLRDESNGGKKFVLLYAYNGTGKTRLSMSFKDAGKNGDLRDTLYFNAYTEDLFTWENDLENDSERHLKINSASRFFAGFKELALEDKIFAYLERYANFDFKIDYENWTISFGRGSADHIKVSRGEENIFIWCIFLAIVELTIEGDATYNWVKYIYIDDPISSLDDNNAIAVASDLAQLLKKEENKIKTVISSHHTLFFNVMCNEIKNKNSNKYFLHCNNNSGNYTLRKTDDTPFFHHVAILSELQKASDSGNLYTYHFNMLRSILEKTATFFGFQDFSACIHGVEDEDLFARALNLLSHGKYSLYEPREMVDDTKALFQRILQSFLERYRFDLPAMISAEETQPEAS